MNRIALFNPLLVLSLLGILNSGCMDMYDQPSFKAQEGPRVLLPQNSIPIPQQHNTLGPLALAADQAAREKILLQRGALLFDINCSMCHGKKGLGDAIVGKKFSAPHPPNLHDKKIQAYEKEKIYQRITNGFGRMPEFKNRLNADERRQIAGFVKSYR
jgi:mono/diheme cytochrome c family protein